MARTTPTARALEIGVLLAAIRASVIETLRLFLKFLRPEVDDTEAKDHRLKFGNRYIITPGGGNGTTLELLLTLAMAMLLAFSCFAGAASLVAGLTALAAKLVLSSGKG